jgi:peptidoglycan glycosyltransferase
LAARAATAQPLVLDRSGEPVATRGQDGALQPLADAERLAGQVLARVRALGLRPAFGPALRLGVDLELSRIALEALGERQGSIVLVDPRSGEVRAAVTDALTARTEPAAAFEQRREPASIAKLMTTAAAYRAGHDADALIGRMPCAGVERYGGQPLWCPWPTGPLAGLDQALAVSCNLAFANLALRVGRERLLDEYRRWGFDAAPAELLGAAGRVETAPELPRQLADLAIGLEHSDVTPLHAALLAAVVANRGRLAQPRLASGACGALGLADAPDPLPPSREVIDPAVAARLEQAMRAVVRYGTAAGLEPRGLEVAMKTGTASTPRAGYHVNYVGYAPVVEPALAFCVRVTGRRSSHGVRADAREVTARLLAALADRLAASARRAPRPGPAPAPAPAR